MEKRISIILISDDANLRFWKPMIGEIQSALGTVKIVLENEAVEKGIRIPCDLFVIDASEKIELPELLDSIREDQPDSKILVVTAAPTWKKAREALRHGASDYIRKYYSSEEMIAELGLL